MGLLVTLGLVQSRAREWEHERCAREQCGTASEAGPQPGISASGSLPLFAMLGAGDTCFSSTPLIALLDSGVSSVWRVGVEPDPLGYSLPKIATNSPLRVQLAAPRLGEFATLEGRSSRT